METTVTLRPPFEYSLWVILVGILLAIAGLVLIIVAIMKISKLKNTAESADNKQELNLKKHSPQYNYILKKKYIYQVQKVVNDYANKKVTKREGYQKLSLIIRGFIHEVSGINVENCTLLDIKALHIRQLDKLMEEYYVPEFAEDEKAESKNLIASCNSTIGVIKTWI